MKFSDLPLLPSANEHAGKHLTCTRTDSQHVAKGLVEQERHSQPCTRAEGRGIPKMRRGSFLRNKMNMQEKEPYIRQGYAVGIHEGVKRIEFEEKKVD